MAATAEKVVLERQAVLDLLMNMGWKSVTKWDNPRIEKKLQSIKEAVAEDWTPENDDMAEVFQKICDGIDDGAEFEVVGEDKKVEDKPKKEKSEKKKSPVPKGIRPKKSRAYVCAEVIKEVGLKKVAENGITDEMIAEVDQRFGKENPRESKAWLMITFHTINGWVKELSVEDSGDEE